MNEQDKTPQYISYAVWPEAIYLLNLDLRLVVAFENAAVPFAEVVDVVDWRVRMVFSGDFRRLDRALQVTAVDGVDMSVFQIFGGAFDLFYAVVVQRAFVPALEDSGLVGHGLPVAQEYEASRFHVDFVVDGPVQKKIRR